MAHDAILDDILKREGWPAYSDDPADRGGPTKGGITQATLAAWRGRPVTAAEVAALGEAEARAIYARRYIVEPKFDRIADDGLRHQVVDIGVLHGPGRATKWLQAAVGVADDGIFGAGTTAAVNAADPQALGLRLAATRVRKIGRIVQADPAQLKWLGGWLNRATFFIDPKEN